jgi:prepilin-type N-terminal cleavage/methylation domain-containing protein
VSRKPIRRSRAQAGFTLIELMIVVAIIAVLAALVVPSWIREARKGKYDPEIRAMFAEISAKEEAYKSEQGNGLYLDGPLCPSAPSSAGINFDTTCVTTGYPNWVTLRISASDSEIRCTYQTFTGCYDTGTNVNCPTGVTSTAPTPPFGTAVPTTLVGPWYYTVAECDMDGQGGTNANFLTESWDTSIQKLNYGS